jgi:ABC-type lipoprotein release transport system permease subunit
MGRVMSSLLFEVSPTDATAFGGVAVVLAVVTLIASWIPARRASRVDPMVTLRSE